MSRLMGAMSVKLSETSVEASYYDLPVTEHVAIPCTPDFVLGV